MVVFLISGGGGFSFVYLLFIFLFLLMVLPVVFLERQRFEIRCSFFFWIGKKENIIEKGIEGKIHRVHNSKQTANRNK